MRIALLFVVFGLSSNQLVGLMKLKKMPQVCNFTTAESWLKQLKDFDRSVSKAPKALSLSKVSFQFT